MNIGSEWRVLKQRKEMPKKYLKKKPSKQTNKNSLSSLATMET